jgi:hypothetical protein
MSLYLSLYFREQSLQFGLESLVSVSVLVVEKCMEVWWELLARYSGRWGVETYGET